MKPKMRSDVADSIIGNAQGLVSRGLRSRGNSYVCEIISAGKITEITLIPTIPIENRNATEVMDLLILLSLMMSLNYPT